MYLLASYRFPNTLLAARANPRETRLVHRGIINSIIPKQLKDNATNIQGLILLIKNPPIPAPITPPN